MAPSTVYNAFPVHGIPPAVRLLGHDLRAAADALAQGDQARCRHFLQQFLARFYAAGYGSYEPPITPKLCIMPMMVDSLRLNADLLDGISFGRHGGILAGAIMQVKGTKAALERLEVPGGGS